MKHCRYTRKSLLGKFSALLFFPLVGIGVFAAGVYLLISILACDMAFELAVLVFIIAIFAFGISSVMFYLSVKFYAMENRKYEITANGIIVSDRKEEFYSWNQVYEVAVVAYAASASTQVYQTVICCLLKPPEKQFLRMILTSYVYGAFHTNDFVIIDYSPCIMNEFTLHYPRQIVDYRKKQLGRI